MIKRDMTEQIYSNFCKDKGCERPGRQADY